MRTYPKDIELGGKWEDIPCVGVTKILEKRDWFNGTIKFRHGITEEYWNGLSSSAEQVGQQPTDITISIPFKSGMNVSFWVEWCCNRNGSHYFRITHNISMAYKKGKTNTCEKVVQKIEDMLVEAIPRVEQMIAEKEAKEKEQAQYKQAMTDLAKSLEISIEPKKYSANEHVWIYRNSKYFGVELSLKNYEAIKEGEEPLFVIEDIHGYFTQEDIKRFIEVLATSRTAVAARLTGE